LYNKLPREKKRERSLKDRGKEGGASGGLAKIRNSEAGGEAALRSGES